MKRSILKRAISLFLALATIALTGVSAFAQSKEPEIPTFSSLEERDAAHDTSDVFIICNDDARARRGLITKYVLADTQRYTNKRLGWHPDFEEPLYADGYFFSTSSFVDMSVSLSIGVVSVAVGQSSSNGIFKSADGNRLSRPWVRADLVVKIYDTYVYDSVTQEHLYTHEANYTQTTRSDLQYFVEYV